jgi:hypothetical protein
MMPIFAVIEPRELGIALPLYFFLGVAFLALSFVILRFVQDNGYKLILLAFLTATVGIGFGFFLQDAALINAGVLMKIAFILALAGVGSLLLSTKESSTAIEAKTTKGSKDAG